MRMKIKLLLSIGLLFCINQTAAQTYYYNTTKTFIENGYTYQCDKASYGIVTLYNKANQYTYAPYAKKDGSPIGNFGDLKSQIWFTLTNNGKKLKFVKVGWMHEIE